MHSYVLVGLSTSWEEAKRYLPRRLVKKLNQADCEEKGQYVYFDFQKDNPIWRELIASNWTVGGKDLVRLVRYTKKYTFAELMSFPYLRLKIHQSVPLAEPVTQFYKFDVECVTCGRVRREQVKRLKIVQGPGSSELGIFETDNYEIIVSRYVREVLEHVVKGVKFSPVEILTNSQQMWQITPLHEVCVVSPPTPLQYYDQCSVCGKPKVVALRTTDKQLSPLNDKTVIEHEALLYINETELPQSNFLMSDIEIGTLAEKPTNVEKFNPANYPYRRARNLWIVTNDVISRLHKHNVKGWSADPVLFA